MPNARLLAAAVAVFTSGCVLKEPPQSIPAPPPEATAVYLERIDHLDDGWPRLNAVIAYDKDAVAKSVAAAGVGPLEGRAVLVKDNIETREWPTTAGSLALADNATGRDAPLIARLRAAGGVVLGKTNLSEWANIRSNNSTSGWSAVGGLTQNPHATDRNACGSSSGSGAAVAADFAWAAIGTETDGSITCPASVNGIVGFKPTVGLVSRTHVVPISVTQDTAGPMAHTVAHAALLLDAVARWGGMNTSGVVLFGIAMVFTFNALVSLVQFTASAEALQNLVFWTMGSLARSSWTTVGVLALAFAVALPLAMRQSWKLTALRLGEDRAASFGVDVRRVRVAALARVSLLAALAVAFVGTIGFIGLVAPHIARRLFGEDHRFYLPGSALVGAVILSLASIASKNLLPGVVVPVGIVTALVGIPFFVSVVLRRQLP